MKPGLTGSPSARPDLVDLILVNWTPTTGFPFTRDEFIYKRA